MAARIGISNSYLSQLEHDDRPMTPSIRQAIGRAFPLNGADFEVDDAQRRTSGFRDAVSDPRFTGRPEERRVGKDGGSTLSSRWSPIHTKKKAYREKNNQ